jgi:hypothetical protein
MMPKPPPGYSRPSAGIISAIVALIAVIVSIVIANRARKTSDAANETAKNALTAAQDNTKTLFRIERPYITGGGNWGFQTDQCTH